MGPGVESPTQTQTQWSLEGSGMGKGNRAERVAGCVVGCDPGGGEDSPPCGSRHRSTQPEADLLWPAAPSNPPFLNPPAPPTAGWNLHLLWLTGLPKATQTEKLHETVPGGDGEALHPALHPTDASGWPTGRQRSHSLSESTRQITPPITSGHAPPSKESRKSSQSVHPCNVLTW